MTDTPHTPPPDAPPQARPFFRWLARIELAIAVFFLFTLAVGVLWQVLGRYVPAANWVGAGEIARFSLIGITFITVGYLIGQHGQITVAVIDGIVKGPRGRTVVRAVSAILLTLICLALTWEAWSMVEDGFRRVSPVLGIPLGYLYLLPLIGFASGTVMAIGRLVRANYDEPDALIAEEAEV
ncbi:hypothetical protein GCM10010977_30070 [Citricoccus zhacaiensis]|uniref:Tripartite ATP-independent periplasmic transporters DctQ component domain-containing protein n=1 Tax=Citricoccus zhacaiensis TaxID=489142 RepID=A0ABQ2MB68_9MICC|nr:TRAP transporter small permease subunit [Citricoccus zhacaiensis]GGO49061.1 hypothetical protein GCM10010977_30070 [Citricoccus zhacaiensis]